MELRIIALLLVTNINIIKSSSCTRRYSCVTEMCADGEPVIKSPALCLQALNNIYFVV